MKRLKSLICLLFFLNNSANAQQECGTKAYNGNDTTILNRLAEQERKIQEWVNTSSESRGKYYRIQYPPLPGFTPTGDYYKDATAYAEAKRLFIINKPDEYRKWVEGLSKDIKKGK